MDVLNMRSFWLDRFYRSRRFSKCHISFEVVLKMDHERGRGCIFSRIMTVLLCLFTALLMRALTYRMWLWIKSSRGGSEILPSDLHMKFAFFYVFFLIIYIYNWSLGSPAERTRQDDNESGTISPAMSFSSLTTAILEEYELEKYSQQTKAIHMVLERQCPIDAVNYFWFTCVISMF